MKPVCAALHNSTARPDASDVSVAAAPGGIAEIAGTRLDVVSDGAFIEALAAIEVTRVDGNRIVVRQRHAA